MDISIDAVKEVVLDEIKKTGKTVDLTVTDEILGAGLVDSMTVLGMITSFEEKYGIVIDGDMLTVENFASIRSIFNMLARIADN